MFIRLLCPSGHVLDIDAGLAGKKVRCGACGKILLVPAVPIVPRRVPQRRPPSPPVRPAIPAAINPPATPRPQFAAPAKPPTFEPEPLPKAVSRQEPISEIWIERPAVSDLIAPAAEAVPRPARSFELPRWLQVFWPAVPQHLPDNAVEPGKGEVRTALCLAAVLIAATLVSLIPLVVLGHFNPASAPNWARLLVLAAILQSAYAAWMANAPDWATIRVQMIASAVVAACYGMLMTLTMMTPVNRPLVLGLGEVRRAAPAWCAAMLMLMGIVTWLCGRTSARWRRRQCEGGPGS